MNLRAKMLVGGATSIIIAGIGLGEVFSDNWLCKELQKRTTDLMCQLPSLTCDLINHSLDEFIEMVKNNCTDGENAIVDSAYLSRYSAAQPFFIPLALGVLLIGGGAVEWLRSEQPASVLRRLNLFGRPQQSENVSLLSVNQSASDDLAAAPARNSNRVGRCSVM